MLGEKNLSLSEQQKKKKKKKKKKGPSVAPTAPKPPRPSIKLASHSTVPVSVRLDPRAALVRWLSLGEADGSMAFTVLTEGNLIPRILL